jgi:hypothetical protein
VLAITWYQWFLAAHILAAVAWAGGALTLTALSIAARRQGDPAVELGLVRLASRIGGPFFGLSAWILLGFGFGLVENGGWGYDHFFIEFGFGAWAFAVAVGALYYSREFRAIDAASTRGPDDLEVHMRLHRYYRIGMLNTVVVLAAVFVMATKPWL